MRSPLNYVGDFVRLSDFRGAANQGPKTLEAAADLNCPWRYQAKPEDFEKIPGSPIAYWVSERVLEVFETGKSLRKIAIPRQGLATTDNSQFLRYWFEPVADEIGYGYQGSTGAQLSRKRWFPYNKGGAYRKWFGNLEYVVDWENDGERILANITRKYPYLNGNTDYVAKNRGTYFKESLTWSKVTSGAFSLRYVPEGAIYDVSGCSIFPKSERDKALMIGVLNSKLVDPLLTSLSPTLNFEVGQVAEVPLLEETLSDKAIRITDGAISLSKSDWDNFETSWDFQTHPLLRIPHPRLSDAFADWQDTAAAAFTELKRLEEENNRYWIDAYGLQDELTPEVPDEQITIRRANLTRDVRNLLSYAVGCMMGRYSLSQPGLQFAGGTFDPSSFSGDSNESSYRAAEHRYLPDPDGILPITDEAYFEDDIVSRFVDFLRAAFGPEHLQENLTFVADALTRKGGESAVARIRRYFVSEFVSDHIQTYKKRPIYWLFTSGKGRAFGALVYLHRYTPDTLSYLRNNYVLPLQSKLEAEIRSTERALEIAGSGSAAKAAQKTLLKLREQVAELLAFHDRLLHKADGRIDIDLDDGVAYNYTLFGDLLYTGVDMKLVDLLKKSQWKRDLLAGVQGRVSTVAG